MLNTVCVDIQKFEGSSKIMLVLLYISRFYPTNYSLFLINPLFENTPEGISELSEFLQDL